ncbi:MAG: DHH family phosphoesterase [Erysipelotrichaceae bacterium]|jgi:single-stranded-DNA-specific exonuclease|nr:DHH family phosphoesterase [Erysipelotrichaceae bacterium]
MMAFRIDPLCERLILANQLNEAQKREVLAPLDETPLPDSDSLKNLCARLLKAKEQGEKIMVAGDYDTDGICATAMLVHLLKQLEIECGFYIPDRQKEGYGLSEKTVQLVCERGYPLIVCVDNGSSAFGALALAESLGMEVWVIDHHQLVPNQTPKNLLHPSQLPARYGHLCGGGLVSLVVRALRQGMDPLESVLAMTATLGDMMEVFGENRWLIQEGLRVLNDQGFLPIGILLAGSQKPYNDTDITFSVVPKLNSVGRLGQIDVNSVVRYLLDEDVVSIQSHAKILESLNLKRRFLTAGIDWSAVVETGDFVVLVNAELPEGLSGIAANQLLNKYKKPSLVLAGSQQGYKGSGRALPSQDLHAALKQCQDQFLNFGGHALACGFELAAAQLPAFIGQLSTLKIPSASQPDYDEILTIDSNQLQLASVQALDLLRPFGTGFVNYPFTIKNLKVKSLRVLKERHLKWEFSDGSEAICFGGVSHYQSYIKQNTVTLKGRLSLSTYRGIQRIVLQVEETDL